MEYFLFKSGNKNKRCFKNRFIKKTISLKKYFAVVHKKNTLELLVHSRCAHKTKEIQIFPFLSMFLIVLLRFSNIKIIFSIGWGIASFSTPHRPHAKFSKTKANEIVFPNVCNCVQTLGELLYVKKIKEVRRKSKARFFFLLTFKECLSKNRGAPC